MGIKRGQIYFIGITNGTHSCGSGQTWLCGVKDIKDARKTAEKWGLLNNHDEVYMLFPAQYTQKVCEMSTKDFISHIKKVGFILYERVK